MEFKTQNIQLLFVHEFQIFFQIILYDDFSQIVDSRERFGRLKVNPFTKHISSFSNHNASLASKKSLHTTFK